MGARFTLVHALIVSDLARLFALPIGLLVSACLGSSCGGRLC